ncbi:MAG: hypothetical protein ACRCYQ_12195 [Nocardioides sp.]
MDTLKSIALFVAEAIAEIGDACLVWQGVREHRGWGMAPPPSPVNSHKPLTNPTPRRGRR